jgi:hypothetical protein
MWVLDYLEDVESDLSVFHRVDDFTALSSVRFYSLTSRLPHYDGAVRHVLTAATAEERQRPALRAVPDISPSTLEAISDHPGFPGIEYAGG